MKKITLLIMAALVFCSCAVKTDEVQKKGSSGKTLEILVVADKSTYNGSIESLMDSIFESPQVGLPQPEQKFNVINIPVSSYQNSDMFRNHRNTLILDISNENENKVYKHIDENAAPQVVFDFAAKSKADLCEMLRKYEQTILDEFYQAEHRRVIKAFKGMHNYKLTAQIKKKFGFSLMFSNEFGLAKEDDNFAWIRKEAKDFGIGVLVDVYPYESDKAFVDQNILDRIDTVMKHHVPASAENSYMGLERRKDSQGNYLQPIVHKTVKFPNSEYCVETRGCWRSFGDFMGGPMVNYTSLSPDNKNIISLTGYVYCPRNKPWTKRDLLMQVESICWSINWDK